ncbi:MAG TPA: carboxypeptidase M32, partial [Gemmataceae bacterium]|nr:carboxypeptidase M32 [Gemmataceae bacterium]
LASCIALLEWDELTCMPRSGAELRANQVALLTGMHHAKATDPLIGDLLSELECSNLVRDQLAPAAINVREIRRDYDRLKRLPRLLVEELARITSLAQQEWEAARRHADYSRFRPWLEKIVALKCQEADAVGYDTIAYDALLDDYEPGARSEAIALLFDALERELVPLVQALTSTRRQADVAILHREFPLDRQRILGETVAAALGFDFQKGRLDTTVHPFCSAIAPGDCRITTRYKLYNFSDGFFGILHEVGHGLYEQGLDPDQHGTPMGEPPSLGLHESQARLWENTVGRSRPFWKHFFPLARAIFPAALNDVRLDDFHFVVNHVERSVIRAAADEITYNLHVVVRFDLERALLAGDLQTADLPQAWNEAYQKYLGITPSNDAEGCLQDGHWAAGLIGYFPTYTLGNIFAAQLFARATQDLGDQSVSFARGNFDSLLGWLRQKIFCRGQRFPAAQLIEYATGSLPDHRPFLQGLKRKYGELYGIDR